MIYNTFNEYIKTLSNILTINEDNKNTYYMVYVDMDGVLVSANEHFEKYFHCSWNEFEEKYGRKELIKSVDDIGLKFWTNMKWLEDGKKLWKFINDHFRYVYILSSPGRYKFAIEGKTIWLNREIEDWIGFFKTKKEIYAKHNHILIDDYNKNINKWNKNEGLGILHVDYKTTISKLNYYLED